MVIIDDHEMVAEGLAANLNHEADMAVVGVAGTLHGGLALVAREAPDVVVMDHHLPDGNGAETGRSVKSCAPDAAVLIVTGEADARTVDSALESGCSGLVAKDQPVEVVADAVRDVYAGGVSFPPDLLTRAAQAIRRPTDGPRQLSERELQVLALLHDGQSTAAIAETLTLSPHTVRNHIRNLTAKLGAHSRIEAVAMAREQGLTGHDR